MLFEGERRKVIPFQPILNLKFDTIYFLAGEIAGHYEEVEAGAAQTVPDLYPSFYRPRR